VSVNKNLKTNYRKDSSKVLGSGIILWNHVLYLCEKVHSTEMEYWSIDFD
jgi:hypothetical protein